MQTLEKGTLELIEKFRQKCLDRFKKFEYRTYKQMHRIVISDEGLPNLKKRAYKMPGYRKVLDTNEQAIYENLIDKQNKNETDEKA